MANNYPTIRPTLLHNYAGMGVLPPDVTFTRASQSGGYYDGRTVSKAEENLLLQSQAFDNASWTKSNVTVTANTTVAPDGTTTADTLTDDSTSGSHRVLQQCSIISSGVYTCSVFVKAGTHNFVQLILRDSGSAINFITIIANLSTGAVSQTGVGGFGGTLVSSAITALADGWYRLQMVGSLPSVGTATQLVVAFAPAATGNTIGTAGNIDYIGTGTTLIIWGAQLEQRSTVTAYTPTTTAPITNYIPKMLFAPANVPVFDHNPVTGEALGLSVWEARTNLLLRSQEFETTWTNEESSEATNVAIAPDGTLTADRLIPNTNNVGHWINQTVTVTAVAHTFSFFAKPDGYSVVQVLNSNSGSDRINFNLATGIVGSASAAYTGTMTNVGNGWYRCSATFTPIVGTAGWARIGIVPDSTSARAAAFAGNGTSGVLIWGAQLEAGAFATPYIPTVASTVARSADVAVMTGVNFSRWFNPAQGAIVADYFQNSSTASGGGLFGISDNTNNNRIILTADGASSGTIEPGLYVTVGGAGQVAIVAGTGAVNTFNKLSGVYAVNNFACSFNGAAVVTDVVGTLPTVDRAYIGLGATGASAINGYIRSLSYYPIALTSAQLQAVTA